MFYSKKEQATKAEKALIPEGHKLIEGVESGLESLHLIELLKNSDKSCIYVAPSFKEIEAAKKLVNFFMPNMPVFTLPHWDIMPYDRSSPARDLMAKRATNLVQLASNNDQVLVLTTAKALLQKVPPKNQLKNKSLELRKGESIKLADLNYHLQSLGYFRCGKIAEIGEYSIRGDIVDIYSSADNKAYRVEFFGDEIEEIRLIDPIKQTSIKKMDNCQVSLISELVLEQNKAEFFATNYKKQFGLPKEQDYLYHAVSQGQSYPGYENYLPLFFEKLDGLFDYIQNSQVVFSGESIAQLAEFFDDIEDYYQARLDQNEAAKLVKKQIVSEVATYSPLKPNQLYFSKTSWLERLDANEVARFSQFATQDLEKKITIYNAFKHSVSKASNPFDKLRHHLKSFDQNDTRLVICCFSKGSIAHMQDLLSRYELSFQDVVSFTDVAKLSPANIGIAKLNLRQSAKHGQVIYLSEIDILGDRYTRRKKNKKPITEIFTPSKAYDLDELVIHKEHGLGKFVGLEQVSVQGAVHDMLKLEYFGGDRLFVPVENMDLVTSYGSDSQSRELDKLGGLSWKAKRAKLEDKIKLAADELLTMAAKRELNKAPKVAINSSAYSEFAAKFPFTETDDQLAAIEDIFDDLQSGKPMDRLICGDVGFGKTEVAMRAAYAVSSGGLQVLVICPTTLLSRQHFNNFAERFKPFGINVEHLSRLVSPSQQKQVKARIAQGKPSIIVGTHALLAEDISADNLGLVIVDEEQHFGVAQKEKLKKLGDNCHYLSLSATPIPRTLQLSLAGVKSLSIIATPPVDRLPVKTFVAPFDPVAIREAIMREKHRAGRIFYVVPKIKDLEKLHGELKLLVPEINIGVAHGQLPVNQLEDIMTDFYEGKYDLLLSTAIVESGLDVKTANTMIIHRADNFGLSALYQLRGRVGRGKTKAYCYLTLEHGKIYTKQALKRLEVMQGLNSLGAGFSVASHDMDIRGYGNVLGVEQSGHIKEVGVELYQQMLNEAVARAKAIGEQQGNVVQSPEFSPIINFGMSVVIPENYIEDLASRMEFYKRASAIKEVEEITDLKIELVDRFGELPEEIQSFIKTIELKILCKKAGVEKLDSGPKAMTVKIRENFHNHENLLVHIMQNSERIKMRPDGKLVIKCESYKTEERLEETIRDLQNLAQFSLN